jgi:NAD+ synthase
MTDRLRLALAQLNPIVGDIAGNVAKLRAARAEAAAQGADLMLASELVLIGYPPEDLVLKPAFIDDALAGLKELAADTSDGGPALLVGTPWRENGRLFNAVALLEGGKISTTRAKVDLPNYGVFDEKRLFAPGLMPGPIHFKGIRLGVPICEDIWTADVVECLAETGAEMILVPNGSPYEAGKGDVRLNLAIERVQESGLPLVYLNQVGGQDELVFDGASFVVNADYSLAVQLPAFRTAVETVEFVREADGWRAQPGTIARLPEGIESIYHAMVLGLGDYVNKNRFKGVVLGMSGGIDSALSAAVAVDALGSDRVHCVMMPSRYTSRDSLDDAAECSRLLGTRLDEIPIEPAVAAFGEMLAPLFAGRGPDITEENIQSRIRGVTLMALSNKFGHMVLTTGNKSEVSVGYATLYGDMCGGYSVLKDVYKMTVFALSRWRNQNRPDGFLGPAGRVIPERIITKAPSAELREDQKDEDSLPPYPVLDAILERLVEQEKGVDDVIAEGFEPATVARVENLLYSAEYKRRQAAPGVKIGRKLFGRDRRYPLVNGYRDAR